MLSLSVGQGVASLDSLKLSSPLTLSSLLSDNSSAGLRRVMMAFMFAYRTELPAPYVTCTEVILKERIGYLVVFSSAVTKCTFLSDCD